MSSCYNNFIKLYLCACVCFRFACLFVLSCCVLVFVFALRACLYCRVACLCLLSCYKLVAVESNRLNDLSFATATRALLRSEK